MGGNQASAQSNGAGMCTFRKPGHSPGFEWSLDGNVCEVQEVSN